MTDQFEEYLSKEIAEQREILEQYEDALYSVEPNKDEILEAAEMLHDKLSEVLRKYQQTRKN